MQLSDPELRALVRDAIARHGQREAPEDKSGAHASHGLLPLRRGAEGDGACLIEPDVRCNHCGYCLSYGH
jgi:hypothetical protein